MWEWYLLSYVPPQQLNIFAKAWKIINYSMFHVVWWQLTVYPGLKMPCCCGVCVSQSQSSWQGVLGEGTRSWPGVRGQKQGGHATQNRAMREINGANTSDFMKKYVCCWLTCINWLIDVDNSNFIIVVITEIMKIYWTSTMTVQSHRRFNDAWLVNLVLRPISLLL